MKSVAVATDAEILMLLTDYELKVGVFYPKTIREIDSRKDD